MIEPTIIGILCKAPNLLPHARIKAEDFERSDCAQAFAAIRSCVADGISPDALTVSERMPGGVVDNLDAVVTWTREAVPSEANLKSWVLKIRERAKAKKLSALLESELHSEDAPDTIRARLMTQLASLEDDERSWETGGKAWMAEVIDKVEEVWEAKHNGTGMVGIPTGLAEMDDILGGFQKSHLIVMGARPKMGKTAWMMNAVKAAAKSGARVGVASAEMPSYQLGQRLVSDVANLSAYVFQDGNLTEAQFSSLTHGATSVSELPIRIYSKPGMTPGDIALQARAWESTCGLDILFVDYLTRLKPDTPSRDRVREVGSMVSSLKTLALSLNIPVVCLAQLSRNLEQRGDKRPMPSDLRDSGEVEQEADIVMFLYRDAVYNREADPKSGEVIIAANRHGPSGVIDCRFDGEFMRWSDRLDWKDSE